MTAHSTGTGSGWNETLDVDQPHGLDYREWNDIRIGDRKRMAQEHSTYADNTVGGIHKPGGSAILGMEDGTATIVADGTLRARGVVWDLSSRLWCATANAGVSTTGDWTLLKLHPDKQWAGQDITWTGGQQFDASVDIFGQLDASNANFDGSVDVSGALDCSVLDVDASAAIGGNTSLAADLSVDGTTALQNTVITGDVTFTFDPIAGETGPTIKMFGDWSQKAVDVTYTARTDGMVLVTAEVTNVVGGRTMRGETPAGTNRVDVSIPLDGRDHLVFPVKGGDTWAIAFDATGGILDRGVYWLPYGDNT